MQWAMRRGEKAMDETEARALLERAEYGVLGLCGGDGEPYTAALNFVFTGEVLYFHSAPEGRKMTVLRSNPRVSLTVVAYAEVRPERFTTYYRSVHLSGRAEIVEDAEEKRRALLQIAAKYAPARAEEAAEYAESALEETAVVRVLPDEITGKENPAKGDEQGT